MKNYLLVIIMIAGLVTGACGDSESASGDTDTAQHETDGELTWFSDDFEGASARAASSGKPLLIDLYADWCGPCVTLAEEFFTSETMRPILSNFVLLRLDVDNPDLAQYSQRYNVSAIPCVVIAEADGTEIDRIVGTTQTVQEYATKLQNIYDQI